jgi:hypothetical protein
MNQGRVQRSRLLGRRSECDALDQLLADALAGRSQVIVVRGEAGVGKSALLRYLSERVAGWHVATAVGVESEMELAYSGLHQLCGPMLDQLDRLPIPQREALATVFGQSSGPPPDRFLVGLAALTLLADAAERQPLVCIVDDAQWLDQASAQIFGFVARRLLAERIAFVCAARTGTGDKVLTGLPELSIQGLGDSDARALLLDNVYGPLDAAVCDQIVTESHGNPLALLELPRSWNVADLAGGFGLPSSQPVVSKIEQSYARRLRLLPAQTQLLVLAAAAEPLGDPALLHVPPSRSASPWLQPILRWTRVCSKSVGASSSRTPWSDPPPTGRPPPRTAIKSTALSPKRPIPKQTRIGVPGIAPEPRLGPARKSPPSSSVRPAGRRLAAESPQRPRSYSVPLH